MNKDSKEKSKFWTYAKPIIFVIVSLCALGITFSFPFIRFSNKIRIFMLILWLLAIIYVWIQVVRVDKIKRQKEQKIKQDKLVYIWSIATAILSFSSILLFSFLNHSFNTNFNVITLPIGIAVLMICLFSVIISVAENKKEFFKGLGKILLYSFLLTLLTTGLMIKNEPNLTDIQRWASLIAIALGAIPLLAISILWISKILNTEVKSKNELTIKYILFIIVIIAILIFVPVLILNMPISNTLADSLITVFSAVAGGSLTLIGVWMEIRHQDKVREKERKEQRKKEISPIIGVYNSFKANTDYKGFNYFEDKNNWTDFIFVACLKNTDKTGFIITGIQVNGTIYENVENDQYVDKGQHFSIKLYTSHYFNIDNCYLLAQDIDFNNHKYKLELNKEANFYRAISIREEVEND